MSKKNIISIEVESLPRDIEIGKTYSINQSNPNQYTHSLFKYPCKFIPEIPRWAIMKYAKEGDLIFDPFSGSGTTLLESKILGYDSIGTEIDPIAMLIIEVKTNNYSKKDLIEIEAEYVEILRKLNDIQPTEVIEPKIRNLYHWFSRETVADLSIVKSHLEGISNDKVRKFLEIVFISLIKPVSNADDSSPKPYVSRKIIKTPPTVGNTLIKIYQRYKPLLEEYSKLDLANSVTLASGDALNTTSNFKANLAITSPPYINAFDYPRTLRLENLWMRTHTEESILKSKKSYVGTEQFDLRNERNNSDEILKHSKLLKKYYDVIINIDEKRAYIVKKFFEDMQKNLINVNRHLNMDAHYVIVIGNSNIRNTIIESWKVLKDISKVSGFETVENFSYDIKNPYLRIPRAGRGGKINQDHVLVLKKVEEVSKYEF